MTLSGLRSLDKSAIVGLLFVVSGQRDPQGRKLLVGFEPTKAFLCFVHGRRGPAQSHRGRTPALHIAGDATHGPHHIFDDVPGLVDLATLDWRVAPEAMPDRLGERLRAVDDKQTRHRWIEAPLD